MKKSVKFLSVLLSVVLFASSSLTVLMMPKGNVRADEFNEEQIEGPAEPDPESTPAPAKDGIYSFTGT